jgi:hypothetical protein
VIIRKGAAWTGATGAKLAAAGIAGSAIALIVPAAASAAPVDGPAGQPPAIIQPAPANPAGANSNPMVPVTRELDSRLSKG